MREIVVYRPGSLGDSIVSLPAIIEIVKRYNSKFILINKSEKLNKKHFDAGTLFSHFKLTKKIIYYVNWLDLIKKLFKLRDKKLHYIFIYLSPERSNFKKIIDYLFFRIVFGINTEFIGFKKINIINEHQKLLSHINDQKIIDKNYIKNIQNFLGLNLKYEIPNDSLILLCCSSKSKPSNLPVLQWVKIINSIQVNHELILIGEINFVSHLKSFFPNRKIEIISHFESIEEMIRTLRKSNKIISIDTGIAHMAALLGLETNVISSARAGSEKWKPLGLNVKLYIDNPFCVNCRTNFCPYSNFCVINASEKYIIESTNVQYKNS